MILLVLAAATSIVNGPVAQPSPTSAPVTVASTDDNKIICQETENTGSLFSERVCHTKSDWRQIQANGKKTQTDLQNMNSIAGSTLGAPNPTPRFTAGGH